MRTFSYLIVFLAGLLIGCSGCQSVDRSTNGTIVTDDNIRLYYVERGTGEPVLVAPAGAYLEPYLMDALSKKRRVIFYDSRNRGRSQAAALDTISLDRQVEDLEQLRRSLGVEKMDLLGWSGFGMEMAVYAIRHPNRVRRLVQLSPTPPTASHIRTESDRRPISVDQSKKQALDARVAAGEFEDDAEKYCRLSGALTLFHYFANPDFVDEFVDLCIYANEHPGNLNPYFSALISSYGDYDWHDELRNLTIPRLIIHGREDVIPLSGAQAWATGYEHAGILILTPSGHFPFIEQQAQTVAAIETFLSGDWPDQGSFSFGGH